MSSEMHAAELQYSLSGNGYVRLKVYVVKKISPVNLKSKRIFVIRTTLRVSIYNTTPININPGSITEYMGYPALFNFAKRLVCQVPSEAQNFHLISYSPVTVNSSITTSRSDTVDKQLTNSSQQSVGSSTSQTNSFGVNVMAGEMMDLPMWSVGLSYDYAYTSAQNQERATASGNSAGQQIGYADSYSIKDWGIYASVNRENLQANWVCAQEYPWDILQYRSQKGDGTIDLPKSIIDRMLIGACVLPPSELSQFGTDFTLAADWTFAPSEENVDMTTELLAINVDTSFVTASHQRTGSGPEYGLSPSLGTPAFNSNALALTWWDLECLALNPLAPGRNDASLNLDKLPAGRFPSDTTIPLTVTSPTNTLLCVADGFSPGMVVDVAGTSAMYKLAFKVTDTVGEISLYIKHWKLDAPGLLLAITVNGVDLPIQFVDAFQGGSGTGNRTDITLRSTDYMAEDFCDYLVVGLNVVTVTVSVGDTTSPPTVARYCLSAVVVS